MMMPWLSLLVVNLVVRYVVGFSCWPALPDPAGDEPRLLVGALAVLLLVAGSYALYYHLEPRPLPPGMLYGNGHVEAPRCAWPPKSADR